MRISILTLICITLAACSSRTQGASASAEGDGSESSGTTGDSASSTSSGTSDTSDSSDTSDTDELDCSPYESDTDIGPEVAITVFNDTDQILYVPTTTGCTNIPFSMEFGDGTQLWWVRDGWNPTCSALMGLEPFECGGPACALTVIQLSPGGYTEGVWPGRVITNQPMPAECIVGDAFFCNGNTCAVEEQAEPAGYRAVASAATMLSECPDDVCPMCEPDPTGACVLELWDEWAEPDLSTMTEFAYPDETAIEIHLE